MAFECKNPYNSALQRGSRTFFPRYLAYGLVNRAARVLAKKLQVLAEIEDGEVLLILPWPTRSRQSRVPRPIICQNLVLERTTLKNTRLTTSGTSIPVSSMSTEMAMWGALLE